MAMEKFTDSDPQYLLQEQYRDPTNLSSRLTIHERFSTNHHGWHRWVFDRFEIPSEARILELGCGTGTLWRVNRDRIPPGWDVTLSDFSVGMIEGAKDNLGTFADRFSWTEIDAQAIPYADGSFDVAIANHMLYHLPDRPRALQELHRILPSGGQLYAAANGRAHMGEIDDLLERWAPEVGRDDAAEKFGLETGLEQLQLYFSEVQLNRYPDSLAVTEAEPILAYLLSTPARETLDRRARAEIKSIIDREIAKSGAFHVTKDAGLFRCRA